MAVKLTLNQIEGIVKRTTKNLLIFYSPSGRTGAELRYAIGDLNAWINQYVVNGTFPEKLRTCFRLATEAGITIEGMDNVLRGLFDEEAFKETPDDLAPLSVVQNSIILALAQEARIIGATEFTSRDDVDAMMQRMKTWFDLAKEMSADEMDSMSYRSILDLHAAVTGYLTETARPLPRVVMIELEPMPTLTASNRIYGDGSRSEEIAAENKIIHPGFAMRELRVLSE